MLPILTAAAARCRLQRAVTPRPDTIPLTTGRRSSSRRSPSARSGRSRQHSWCMPRRGCRRSQLLIAAGAEGYGPEDGSSGAACPDRSKRYRAAAAPWARGGVRLKADTTDVRTLPRYGLCEEFDRREVERAGDAVAAAGREIDEAELVDFAQVRILHLGARRRCRGIELVPAHPAERDFDRQELALGVGAAAAGDVAAVGQFRHRTNHV